MDELRDRLRALGWLVVGLASTGVAAALILIGWRVQRQPDAPGTPQVQQRKE